MALSNHHGSVQELSDLLSCLYQLGRDVPDLLISLAKMVQPQLSDEKAVTALSKMFADLPTFLSQQHSQQIQNLPSPEFVTLRLLIQLQELQKLIHNISHLQLLHLTNNLIPPATLQTQAEFMEKVQQIFQSWTRETLLHYNEVLSSTPLHMERQQLLQLEPHIPWELLHFVLEMLKLPLDELCGFQEWLIKLPKSLVVILVQLLQLEPSSVLELKQRMSYSNFNSDDGTSDDVNTTSQQLQTQLPLSVMATGEGLVVAHPIKKSTNALITSSDISRSMELSTEE